MNYSELINGDLSDIFNNPTVIVLDPGSNQITGITIGGGNPPGDRDYFRFSVPTGFSVSSIRLTSYSQTGGGGDSYFGLDTAGTLPNPGPPNPSGAGLISSLLIDGAQLNQDLLSLANLNGVAPINSLSAGSYDVWYQETGGNTAYTFNVFLLDNLTNDSINGDSGNNRLFGGGGNDTIRGQGGADTLEGGSGNDSLDSDTLGTLDTIGDFLDGGNGNDTLQGEAGDDTLEGGSGADSLIGDDGSNAGDDSLLGETGDDTLNGAGGRDTLKGGDGNDLLIGGQGADTLKGQNNNDTLNGLGNNDSINGGAGDDTLNGGGGNDFLAGTSGRDFMKGSLGNDTLNGGSDRDILIGGSGNDFLIGGGDLDILNGVDNGTFGVGERDSLTGGAGTQDRFKLGETTGSYYLDAGAGGTSSARIKDFEIIDRIMLSGSSSNYRLVTNSGDTFILRKEPGPDDTVGIVENFTGLNLNGVQFIYI